MKIIYFMLMLKRYIKTSDTELLDNSYFNLLKKVAIIQ